MAKDMLVFYVVLTVAILGLGMRHSGLRAMASHFALVYEIRSLVLTLRIGFISPWIAIQSLRVNCEKYDR